MSSSSYLRFLSLHADTSGEDCHATSTYASDSNRHVLLTTSLVLTARLSLCLSRPYKGFGMCAPNAWRRSIASATIRAPQAVPSLFTWTRQRANTCWCEESDRRSNAELDKKWVKGEKQVANWKWRTESIQTKKGRLSLEAYLLETARKRRKYADLLIYKNCYRQHSLCCRADKYPPRNWRLLVH